MQDQYSKSNRFFSESERKAAFIAANGICQQCGKPLPANFHADHKHPFSKGGETSIDNLQALCPDCNIEKGAKVMAWTPPGITLRPWQIKAIDEYVVRFFQRKSNVFLAQATPGGGKTIFACAVARLLLDQRVISRVLVVSPSATLREGWADEMSRFGIEIDPECGGHKERTSEFIGKSTTYQTLMKIDGRNGGAEVERILQNQNKTLAIIDEVHHAGDSLSWGDGLKVACQNAAAILCLSGTPFRSDGNPIPFVEYDAEGQAKADYVYGYPSALSDNPQVCRAVYFPSYEGNLSWLADNKIYQASFADTLDENLESQRLRAALLSGEWLESTIKDAQKRLSDIRVQHPDAAGLIVAMDKKHAYSIAKLLTRITSSTPLVVTSDDPDAADAIKAFRNKADPWIIAVKMISEGVDIKRLRVCVYLSNVITELYFRQVVGRIVRFIPGIPDQEAFFYIPADRRLVDMAMRFREERIQGLLKDPIDPLDEDDEGFDQTDLWDDLPNEPSFRILSGQSWHESTITYEGETYSPQELTAAEQYAARHGYKILAEVMAKILRDNPTMNSNPVNGHKDEPAHQPEPAYQRHREIRSRLRGQENKCLSELRERHYSAFSVEEGFKRLNGSLKRLFGEKGGLTPEQVNQRHEMLLAAVASTSRPSWIL
jgi:superfamily II DNA or RNA helicase